MLNLYANSINPNGFISLVKNTVEKNDPDFSHENRKIISTFIIASILVLAFITNGTQFQKNFELAKMSEIATYTSTI